MVGSFLILEGSDGDLRPLRETTGTLLLDDVQPCYDRFVEEGTVIEYVRHSPDGNGCWHGRLALRIGWRRDQVAFFRPALLEVSDNKLAIVQQESFGPALTIGTVRISVCGRA